MIDRAVLLNAFRPATELDDPERFAGRDLQVRTLTDTLHTVGSTALIYGDRGLGKTSLALQIRRIAMGDVELLSHLKAERLKLPENGQFLTFFVTCTGSTRTLQDLLQAMINAAESVANIEDVQASHLVDRTSMKKLTLKFVEFESTKRYQTESARLSYQDLNLEEKFVQLCELLSTVYDQPVLFVVDELDRMEDTSGLATFLKAASSELLKFVLVGIASHVTDLLTDHQSMARGLVPVRLPLMELAELGQIVVKAQNYLHAHGIEIRFSDDALLDLTKVAGGFPWFVHVLGQQALRDADERSTQQIHSKDIVRATRMIVGNQFAQQFADSYQMAVRDSHSREMTLRAFAEWREVDIPTGEIYRLLSGSLDVRNGSAYRGHLFKPEYGSVLFAPAFQKRGLVRFRNEMFKAYIRMRPSIYGGVDQQVKRAWDERNRLEQ